VLPGADVDARDGECVGGLGGAEEHGVSIAWERQFTVRSSQFSDGGSAGTRMAFGHRSSALSLKTAAGYRL
jgi:hypothetical protein